MNMQSNLVVLPFVILAACIPHYQEPQIAKALSRYQGYANILKIERIGRNTINVTYKIRNGTKERWCLFDPKTVETAIGLTIRSAIDQSEIEIHTVDDFGHLGGYPQATKLKTLPSGGQVIIQKQIDTRDVILDDFDSSDVRVVLQVEQIVLLCDKLRNSNELPYNFSYDFSTETSSGNSFLLVSEPSNEFTIPNLSKR